ncbi:hypothetical protein ACET3Z_019678 [Daucus carota]
MYKNQLQELAQRSCFNLPSYTSIREGIVELADILFHGEPAKNKKQAEKNAALAAWSSLKQLAKQDATLSSESENSDEQEQIRISRALLNYKLKENMGTTSSTGVPVPFQKKFPVLYPRASSPHPPSSATTSRILSLIGQKTIPQNRPASSASVDCHSQQSQRQSPEIHASSQIFRSAGAAPYVPYRQFRTPYHGMAQPVIMRTAVPAYASPPLPTPLVHPPHMIQPRGMQIAPPVHIRQSVVAFAAPPVGKVDHQIVAAPALPNHSKSRVEEMESVAENRVKESNHFDFFDLLRIRESQIQPS